MSRYSFINADDYKDELFGPHLLKLVDILDLPIPEIKVWHHKEQDRWMSKARLFGRQREPKTANIVFGKMNNSMLGVVNDAMHDAIARLCGRHRKELGKNYFCHLGGLKEDGQPFDLTNDHKRKISSMSNYNQDMEQYIKNLQMDHLQDLLNEKNLLAEIEAHDSMEEKFETQEYEIETIRLDLDDSQAEVKKLQAELKKVQDQNKKLRIDNEFLKDRLADYEGSAEDLYDDSVHGPLISNALDDESTM